MLKIKTYRDATGEYRWSAIDANNRIIADGAEGYATKAGLEKAIRNVISEFVGGVQFVTAAGARKTLVPTTKFNRL